MAPRALLRPAIGLLVAGSIAATAAPAQAHGLAGKRFFPATLAIEDPFVADELSLPLVTHIKRPARGDEPATRETEVSAELSKRITPDLGISIEGEWLNLNPEGARSHTGFGNLEIGAKYQLLKSDAHELILSLGFGMEIGGTGRHAVEAESFDVFKPALFFGKGLGDLPDALAYLKPLAVTAVLGAELPDRAKTRRFVLEGDEGEFEFERHPNVIRWGFAMEYSLPYLQEFVRDVGLPAPFNRMIPVVELDLRTPIDRGQAGKTTGTINPGIIWAWKYVQVGVEAVIPLNERTGKNVGVRGMLHFFLDDLFPTTLGKPLFGK
jgi:hypothetical protein